MPKLISLTSFLLAGSLAGCVDGSAGSTSPVSGTGSDGRPVPGSIGTVKLRLFGGEPRDVTYVVDQHGHMIWEGDMDLGPVPDVSARAEIILGLDHRWPNGIVRYAFSSATAAADLQTELAAMRDWEAKVPGLAFIPGDSGGPFILFKPSDETDVSYTDVIGPDGTSDGDDSDIHIWPGSAQHTVEHEIGHALGMLHEADRPDRETVVHYSPGCVIDGKEDQFENDNSGSFATVFAYDIHSIMEYPSADFCIENAASTLTDHCACFPLVKASDGSEIFGAQNLSALDTMAMQWAYETPFGQHVAGHRFGAAVAAGDFDGDGIVDLAIGSPGDGWPGLVQAGAIYLYRGRPDGGFIAWNKIAETDLTDLASAGDNFGQSLAVADFDGDGTADLVVGTPHGASSFAPSTAAGVAFVIFGNGAPAGQPFAAGIGLAKQGVLRLSQGNTGTAIQAEAQFGAALAIGDFDGSGVPGLAIGSPDETVNGAAQAGWVHTFRFDRTQHDFTNRGGVGEPSPAASDHFGTAIAVGNFNDDTRRDLAVGAPGRGAGAVFVYTANASGYDPAVTIAEPTSGSDPAVNGDRFGADLTVGNFDGARYSASDRLKRELVIGAPGHAASAGRISLSVPMVTSAPLTFTHAQTLGTASPAGNQLGGHLMAVSNADGFDDVVAGLPLDDEHGPNAGSIWVFRGGTGGLATATDATASSTVSSTGVQMGSALSVITGAGTNPLIIAGEPANDGNAGAFSVFGLDTATQFVVRDETTVFPLR